MRILDDEGLEHIDDPKKAEGSWNREVYIGMCSCGMNPTMCTAKVKMDSAILESVDVSAYQPIFEYKIGIIHGNLLKPQTVRAEYMRLTHVRLL